MEPHSKNFAQDPYPGTQAVSRAIRLLKAFSDTRPELSLGELAEAAHLKKTTAFRLLSALESEGMLARGAQAEAYRLGPEIVAMGGLALRSSDLRSIGHPELEGLAQETGETATLEILVDGEVFIFDEVLSHYLLGTSQWIGTRWPVHATSTGKAILAYLPPDKCRALLACPLERFTEQTITLPESLETELEQVRQRGYSMVDEEMESGYVAFGAPVFNHEGHVIAAISIGGPTIRLTTERIPQLIHFVKEAAQHISMRMGYRLPGQTAS